LVQYLNIIAPNIAPNRLNFSKSSRFCVKNIISQKRVKRKYFLIFSITSPHNAVQVFFNIQILNTCRRCRLTAIDQILSCDPAETVFNGGAFIFVYQMMILLGNNFSSIIYYTYYTP